MAEIFTILPNLSIGVVSVLSLAYYALKSNDRDERKHEMFIQTLDERADKHERAMNEREQALRNVEASVRENLTDQLSKNTVALTDVAKLLARVGHHLDGDL